MTEWTDKHYDFTYELTEDDISKRSLKIDPYFVAKQWKTGSKDDSGALFHVLKTVARFGDKNDVDREVKALHAQVLGVARSFGVELEAQPPTILTGDSFKGLYSKELWYPDDSGKWREVDKDSDWSHLKGKKLEVLAIYEREREAYHREVGLADWWFEDGWGNKVAYKIVE